VSKVGLVGHPLPFLIGDQLTRETRSATMEREDEHFNPPAGLDADFWLDGGGAAVARSTQSSKSGDDSVGRGRFEPAPKDTADQDSRPPPAQPRWQPTHPRELKGGLWITQPDGSLANVPYTRSASPSEELWHQANGSVRGLLPEDQAAYRRLRRGVFARWLATLGVCWRKFGSLSGKNRSGL
jgi:hypothetical protein